MSKKPAADTQFTTALFLVFLVLKLTNYIDWSWWWVTAPLWIPLAMLAVLVAGFFCIGFIKALLK